MNKIRDITNLIGIKRIVKKYCKQLYVHNLITDKVDEFQRIQTAKTQDRRNRYIHSPISIKEFK